MGKPRYKFAELVDVAQLQALMDRFGEVIGISNSIADVDGTRLTSSGWENACARLGIGFTVNDFGTGYSSLTYLKRLSVGQLKIDQSFVRDMLDDPDNLAILGAVLGLASALRRQVIAESVATVEHRTMLLQLGCELAQRFGIAYPMPAADLPA